MKLFGLPIIGLMLAVPSISFAGSNLNLGVSIEDYTWSEHINGAVQPKEHGNRLALFLDYANTKTGEYYFAYAGKIYGGTVPYDTCTMGACTPTVTTSDYLGMYNEVKLVVPSSYVNGIYALGFDYWTRNINNGYAPAINATVLGYTEQYNVFYVKVGANVKIGSKANVVLGMKQTLQNNEQILNSNIPGIHPGSSTTPYLEANFIVAEDLAIGLYYDGYNFAGGNPNAQALLQPASKMQAIGTKLTWLF
jgi:hypothetical protein